MDTVDNGSCYKVVPLEHGHWPGGVVREEAGAAVVAVEGCRSGHLDVVDSRADWRRVLSGWSIAVAERPSRQRRLVPPAERQRALDPKEYAKLTSRLGGFTVRYLLWSGLPKRSLDLLASLAVYRWRPPGICSGGFYL